MSKMSKPQVGRRPNQSAHTQEGKVVSVRYNAKPRPTCLCIRYLTFLTFHVDIYELRHGSFVSEHRSRFSVWSLRCFGCHIES
jgi:hypothetical protein